MNTERILYFAYGSNLWHPRMIRRCPGARFLGTGRLAGYRVAERLYADIEQAPRHCVWGAVYSITRADLRNLDICEGAPGIYRHLQVSIRSEGRTVSALTYVMTPETAAARQGKGYPDWYRDICSEGAKLTGIRNDFRPRGTGRRPQAAETEPVPGGGSSDASGSAGADAGSDARPARPTLLEMFAERLHRSLERDGIR